MGQTGKRIRVLMNQSFSAKENGKYDEAIKLYTQYLQSDYGRKDASAGFNAAIGIAYCKMYQHKFNDAIGVLLPISLQGRFAIRRLTLLMLAYCYAALKNEQESNRYYDAYTQLIASDNRDQDRSYYDDEDDVDGEEDYQMDDNFEEYDQGDDGDRNEDYEYEDYDYDIDVAKGLNYASWIKYDTEEIFTIPGILQEWINFLSNSEKWLRSEKEEKVNIAEMLVLWADKAVVVAGSEKISSEARSVIIDIAYKCLDLSVVFNDDLKASCLYKKAEMVLQGNKNAALAMYGESLKANPEFTPSLLSMAKFHWLENDTDTALNFLERYEAAYTKNNWKLGSNYYSLLASVYFSAGMVHADSGDYRNAAEQFRKYLELTQPHVYSYVKRPGNRPEDLWVALAEGYDLYNALPISGATEKLRRSLLFADIAIAEDNSAKGYSAKANICCNANKWEEALVCIEEALKKDPNHAYSYYVKACTLSRMKAPETEIYESIKKVVALDQHLAKSMRTESDLKHLHGKAEFLNLFN